MMLMNFPRAGAAVATLVALTLTGCGSSEPPRPLSQADSAEPADSEPSDVISDPQVTTVAHTERVASSNGKSGKRAFDPLEVNGAYFEGWPKPKLALVISGRQDGYLEPCGCAGLENQKGGFNRRYSLFSQLRARGWPLAAVDVGGMVRRFGKQAELQFAISAEALKKMGYSGVGFGPDDLKLSAGEIVAAVAAQDPKDSIFVSANVNLFGLTPKVRVVTAGGLKLGITSVLGPEYQQQVNNAEIEIQPAAEAIKQVIPQLDGCDVRVLLAHTTEKEATALAKQFPKFDLVVCADGADEPPAKPPLVEGTKSRMVVVGHKGMYVIVAGFYDDPKQPIRFQRVALDSRFPNAPEMQKLMTEYQDQLEQLGWQGLGLKGVPHPKAKKGDKTANLFAGAASCKECHPTAWGVWNKSKHAHATETLVKLDPPRQFDPECVSCHSTGWNPQEFFPYVGGFDGMKTTPLLANNSCENCHGPGAAHNAAEKGRNLAKRDAEREAIKLTAAFAKENVCIQCHDHDNSPDFDFDKYWPKVEHKGKR